MLLQTVRSMVRLTNAALLQTVLPCASQARMASSKGLKPKKERVYLKYADNMQYGIYAAESGYIREAAIEEGRISIVRSTGFRGVWHVKSEFGWTKRPVGTRMGKGKGKVAYWSARVYGGEVMYEFDSPSHSNALKAFHGVKTKMPISCVLRRTPVVPRQVLSAEEFEKLRRRDVAVCH